MAATYSKRPLDVLCRAYEKLYMLDDPVHVWATLGAYQANRMRDVPVWLLLVGGAGSGGSSLVDAMRYLPGIIEVSDLTAAAFMPVVAKRDKSKQATGGLLGEVESQGGWGVLSLSDFTSVLVMPHEAKRAALGVMRHVYDGHYEPSRGTDGGARPSWRGKVGLVGKSTVAIDNPTNTAHLTEMGNRMIYCRMESRRDEAAAMRTLNIAGHRMDLKEELAVEVAEYMAALPVPEPVELGNSTQIQIANLATFASVARTHVDRHPHTNEIISIPEFEHSPRMTGILHALYSGVLSLGCTPKEAYKVARKCAWDSIPSLKALLLKRALDYWRGGQPEATQEELVRGTERIPSPNTIARALDDLRCLQVVLEVRSSGPRKFRLTDWAEEKAKRANL